MSDTAKTSLATLIDDYYKAAPAEGITRPELIPPTPEGCKEKCQLRLQEMKEHLEGVIKSEREVVRRQVVRMSEELLSGAVSTVLRALAAHAIGQTMAGQQAETKKLRVESKKAQAVRKDIAGTMRPVQASAVNLGARGGKLHADGCRQLVESEAERTASYQQVVDAYRRSIRQSEEAGLEGLKEQLLFVSGAAFSLLDSLIYHNDLIAFEQPLATSRTNLLKKMRQHEKQQSMQSVPKVSGRNYYQRTWAGLALSEAALVSDPLLTPAAETEEVTKEPEKVDPKAKGKGGGGKASKDAPVAEETGGALPAVSPDMVTLDVPAQKTVFKERAAALSSYLQAANERLNSCMKTCDSLVHEERVWQEDFKVKVAHVQ